MNSLIALFITLLVTSVSAALVPQQRGTPCDAAWDVGGAEATPGLEARQPWDAVCADGDPRCDLDGDENRECRMTIGACVAVATVSCTPRAIRKVRIPRATRKKLPGLTLPPAGIAGCGDPVTLALPVSDTPVPLTLRSGKRGASRVRVRCKPLDPSLRRKELLLRVSTTTSDFDWGWVGAGHNYALSQGARFTACLSGCDDTTDPACDVRACTPKPLPPLPLLLGSLPVCLVLHIDEGQSLGTFDLASGALAMPVTLRADVHAQMPLSDVCPRCSGGTIGARGTCSNGERQQQACVVDAYSYVTGSSNPDYFLSSDCPPEATKLVTSLAIATMLTTGDSTLAGPTPCPEQFADDVCGEGACTVDCSGAEPTKRGINQMCCSTDQWTPCFPTAPDSPGAILRTGLATPLTPAWPSPAASHTAGAVLAATFCSPKTTDQSVDILYGLPGPVALLLPVDMEVHTVIAPP
ncbi:MAG TPA: hypothetical protein VGR62_04765 [Candidatus Binatia bacterium]|jgi:hypothetical protein|nr:hypothetical protein [Candidatus Binatia bacterium]